MSPYRVLLVSESDALASEARNLLCAVRPDAVLQRLGDPSVAGARLGGGGIQLLLVDPAVLGARLSGWMRELPPIPTVVIAGDWTAELSRRTQIEPTAGAKWVGFIGAKGGVGTSTVSLNVAYTLADHRTVLLAELSSGADSLALHVATMGNASRIPRRVVEKPSLRLALREDLQESAVSDLPNSDTDLVLFDLGAILTDSIRPILPRLDSLIVVMDREALSLECAQRTLSAVSASGGTSIECVGALIVNRCSIANPPGLDEIAKALGLPILGVIPPAADLCCAAAKARRPVICFDRQSLVAESLADCAVSILSAMNTRKGEVRGFSKAHA